MSAFSLPAFPEFSVLDATAFTELLLAHDDLIGSPGSSFRQTVKPLLSTARSVRQSDPFPSATWSDWSDEDLVALLDRIALESFLPALAFIPERHLRWLILECGRNLVERCETLFAVHVARSGSPRAEDYVERYAIALALWRSALAEQERRWMDPKRSHLRVLTYVAKHGVPGEPGAQDEAVRLLQQRYLGRSGRMLEAAHAANSPVVKNAPVGTGPARRRAHQEEADGELGALLAQTLARLEPSRGQLLRQAVSGDPAVGALPTRVHRDAINRADELRALGRVAPGPIKTLGAEHIDEKTGRRRIRDIAAHDLDARADVPRPGAPGTGLDLRRLDELAVQHLPSRDALILRAFVIAALVDGEIPDHAEIASRVGITGRDRGRAVRRAVARAVQHPVLGPFLRSLR